MSVSTADSRPVPQPCSLVWPIAGTVALVLAVFLAPFPMASEWPAGGYPSRAALVDALNSGFVRYWNSGSGVVGPELAHPVDFWARFHVVKAALAGMLLLVVVPLSSRAWTAHTLPARGARRLLGGVLTGMAALLALVALVVLVANTQGAIAPLSSALGLLPMGGRDPALAETITQVRGGLARGGHSPAVEALVHDYTVYHGAMAGLGAVVPVGLLATAVLGWRLRARMPAMPCVSA